MALLKRSRSGKKPAPLGRLIVIDGADGKTNASHQNLLAETLKLQGYAVETAEFPREEMGELFKQYSENAPGEITPHGAAVFYALERFNFSPQLREWLQAGKIVIAHRYVSTNASYQGSRLADHAERVAFLRWLNHLEYQAFGIPRPDLTLILHSASKANKEISDTYLEVTKLMPNTRIVELENNDKKLPLQQVQNRIWELVRRIGLKDFPVNNGEPK